MTQEDIEDSYAERNKNNSSNIKIPTPFEYILNSSPEDKKLIWKCPNCDNTDQDLMNIARRTCGYIGSTFWNKGKTQEIIDRVLHI